MVAQHNVIEKDWKKFLTCRWCGETKELTEQFWSRDKSSKLWFVYRCKDCMHNNCKEASHKYYMSHKEQCHEYNLKYNSEHREEIRNKRRGNRGAESIRRRERMKEISAKQIQHAREMGYWRVHSKACRVIKQLWIRPNSCPICGYEWLVVSHHPDYNKWNEVVFCCSSCHKLIHNWEIDVCDKIIRICECDWDKQLIPCERCGVLVHNKNGTRYCSECKRIATNETQKRFRQKHLYNN